MTGHIGFSYMGLIFLLMLRIPNVIWTTKKEYLIKRYSFQLCGRWDLNPHVHAYTRSLVLPVCQFQHSRIR